MILSIEQICSGVAAAVQCKSTDAARGQIAALLGKSGHAGPDPKELGKFLAHARMRLHPAQARSVHPLKNALAEALQAGDAELLPALEALWARRTQIFAEMNADPGTVAAWEEILSAAIAEGFESPAE